MWIVRAAWWLLLAVAGVVALAMALVAVLALLPLIVLVPPTLLILGLAEAMADSD